MLLTAALSWLWAAPLATAIGVAQPLQVGRPGEPGLNFTLSDDIINFEFSFNRTAGGQVCAAGVPANDVFAGKT